MPHTDTSSVLTRPCTESTHPSRLSSRKRGISSTTPGTISRPSVAAKSRRRPGNSSRAKAYPAAAEVATCPSTTHPAKTRVLAKNRPNGSAVSAAG